MGFGSKTGALLLTVSAFILPASASSTNSTECTETLPEMSEVFFSANCLCTKFGDEGLLAVSEYMKYFMGGALNCWVREAFVVVPISRAGLTFVFPVLLPYFDRTK